MPYDYRSAAYLRHSMLLLCSDRVSITVKKEILELLPDRFFVFFEKLCNSIECPCEHNALLRSYVKAKNRQLFLRKNLGRLTPLREHVVTHFDRQRRWNTCHGRSSTAGVEKTDNGKQATSST